MFLNQVFEAQRRFQAELMSRAGVVGVGIGVKQNKDEPTDELALIAMVEQKRPIAALGAENLVPPEVDGIKTDVIEVGLLQAQNVGTRDHWRPIIPPGVSIAHYLVTAGTYGALVYDNITGEPFILSNNHVLANSNGAVLGDPILQPGATDGGVNPVDAVATLERYGQLLYVGDPAQSSNPIIGMPTTPDQPNPPPINPNNPPPRPPANPTDNDGCAAFITGFATTLAKVNDPDAQVVIKSQAQSFDPIAPTTVTAQAAIATNQIDAALARPKNANMFSDEILNIGRITGTVPVTIQMPVRKMGRTTGLTQGTVTVINATVDVGYTTISGRRTARFTGQVMATGMSQGGDSGSLVVDANSQRAVGLLFAGSGAATIFTPISLVLEKLGVRMVREAPVG